jgi:hypothetical protein
MRTNKVDKEIRNEIRLSMALSSGAPRVELPAVHTIPCSACIEPQPPFQ